MNSYWTEAAQLYLILHQSCFSLKSDPQDLLRSVCFQKLYFHCSSAEEWSSSHIFWGSLNHHWIALHYMCESFQSHLIIGDTEWRLIFRSFYVSICCSIFQDVWCRFWAQRDTNDLHSPLGSDAPESSWLFGFVERKQQEQHWSWRSLEKKRETLTVKTATVNQIACPNI